GSTPLLVMALVSALSIELISMLYRRECDLLPKRDGRLLVAFRMSAVLILIFMLLQPVLVGELTRTISRRVVVLLDDSASMNFKDKYWTLEERIEVAVALGALEDARDADFTEAIREVPGLADDFSFYRIVDESKTDEEGSGLDNKKVGETAKKALSVLKPLHEKFGGMVETLPQEEFGELRETVSKSSSMLEKTLLPTLEKLTNESGKADASLGNAVSTCANNFNKLSEALPKLERAFMVSAYNKLEEEKRQELLALSDETRAEISRRLLTEDGLWDGSSAVNALKKVYDVDIYRFAADAVYDSSFIAVSDESAEAGEGTNVTASAGSTNLLASADMTTVPGDPDSSERETARVKAFRSATDITAALEKAMEQIPSEQLAGFLVITDGRFNGPAGMDAVSRRLGNAGVPISTVVVGGTEPPMDIAFGAARAPQSIFLGDKVIISGSVDATRATGKEAKVGLFLGEEKVEEQIFTIDNDVFTREFRFTHVPESKGVLQYRLEIEEVPGEEFVDNNYWVLDVAVTDDRTNVLLVDNRPRWEFRYLRNLFYGRDKSVHLQEYLVKPDTVFGQPEIKLPPASASREFGDSESGDYPETREEWRKFDVIILGDLKDEHLPDSVIEEITYCVNERGALLVVIAGQNYMPHKIWNPQFREVLPILYEPSDDDYRKGPEEKFKLELTPSGRMHPTMMQSSSQSENEAIWEGIAEFDWRYKVDGVKPGAEVLAYALDSSSTYTSLASLALQDMEKDPDAAVRLLAEKRQEQAVNSLMVAQTYGKGKVFMLNTDRTWRLRYKVGDVLHHQFWGQVLKWGAGEKLRAGNDFLRIGTDRLRYTPGEPIKVYARISDRNYNALNGLSPTAILHYGDSQLETIRLRYREGSNGFYEGELRPLADPGRYKLTFESSRAESILGQEYPFGIETHFVVVTAENPAEFVDITASSEMPLRMAEASKGKVVGPARLGELLNSFGKGNRVVVERTERPFWNSGLLFLMAVALVTAEWIIRKRNGVA
ncbi:MAG: hypothetical protein GX804_10240, partial [Lentisphaerae bacterium]|nr:hypothetical protein [Lentisphaerota bacterium]